MTSDAVKRATANYHRKCKKLLVLMNPDKDADIIEHLDKVGNKSGYVKNLIRLDALRLK